MTSLALDNGDLRRWIASAALVLALHAAGTLVLMRWKDPIAGDDGSAAVVVDLTPYVALPEKSDANLAPGPLQQQSEATPQPQEQKPEERVEKAELPPAPEPEVVLPEETKAQEPPKEQPTERVPQTTAPPPPRPTAAETASWHRKIVTQLERNKRYPPEARSRRQSGEVLVAFTIDRQGRVVSSRIVRSSGVAALDKEMIAAVQRAQPFPPPPPNMPGETFDFTRLMQFNIR
jgi:periplasmic protein TonB